MYQYLDVVHHLAMSRVSANNRRLYFNMIYLYTYEGLSQHISSRKLKVEFNSNSAKRVKSNNKIHPSLSKFYWTFNQISHVCFRYQIYISKVMCVCMLSDVRCVVQNADIIFVGR